jgi:hypothetical protein
MMWRLVASAAVGRAANAATIRRLRAGDTQWGGRSVVAARATARAGNAGPGANRYTRAQAVSVPARAVA